MTDVCDLLRKNPYPGRGIAVGLSGDGSRSVMLYFIMGRSENSRNRIFERTGDGVRTAPRDPAALKDPSLVIYTAVRRCEGRTIVTNGDHTDTILESLLSGSTFEAALRTREFEPDSPNYTPRISGLIERDGGYALSILKTAGGDPSGCFRSFFEYREPIPGMGHFIHTYKGDGDPLPAFEGEPAPVKIDVSEGLERFAERVWGALDESNRVSLYARETDLGSGESADIIINKQESP